MLEFIHFAVEGHNFQKYPYWRHARRANFHYSQGSNRNTLVALKEAYKLSKDEQTEHCLYNIVVIYVKSNKFNTPEAHEWYNKAKRFIVEGTVLHAKLMTVFAGYYIKIANFEQAKSLYTHSLYELKRLFTNDFQNALNYFGLGLYHYKLAPFNPQYYNIAAQYFHTALYLAAIKYGKKTNAYDDIRIAVMQNSETMGIFVRPNPIDSILNIMNMPNWQEYKPTLLVPSTVERRQTFLAPRYDVSVVSSEIPPPPPLHLEVQYPQHYSVP